MAFVTARLQRRSGSSLLASLALAPLFGHIHFSLLLTASGAVGGGRLSGALLGIAVLQLLFLYSGPVRVIVTWVYNTTDGSLPIVALLHASIDTTLSGAVLTTFYPRVDGIWLNVALAVVALALILLTRGRLCHRQDATVPRRELLRQVTRRVSCGAVGAGHMDQPLCTLRPDL